MTHIELPRYVDDPPHLLLWSADEIAPLAIGLVVGVMLSQALIFTLIGLVLTKAYARYRDGKPDGYFLHVLYWIGALPTSARTIPNPFAREFHI